MRVRTIVKLWSGVEWSGGRPVLQEIVDGGSLTTVNVGLIRVVVAVPTGFQLLTICHVKQATTKVGAKLYLFEHQHCLCFILVLLFCAVYLTLPSVGNLQGDGVSSDRCAPPRPLCWPLPGHCRSLRINFLP